MTATPRFQVNTVFSADAPRSSRSAGPAPGRSLGVVSLVVAMAWLYATWYPIDRFLVRAMVKATMAQPLAIDWTAILGVAPEGLAPPPPPDTATTPEDVPADEIPPPPSEEDLETVLRRLTIDMYAWLTVTTFTALWLAMCGGAGLADRRAMGTCSQPLRLLVGLCGLAVVVMAGMFWTRQERLPTAVELAFACAVLVFGLGLCVCLPSRQAPATLRVLVAGLLAVVAFAWWKYQTGWPAVAPRICVMLLFLIAALIGVLKSGSVGRPHGTAVWFVLLSSGATLVAIWYGNRHGGFVGFPVTAATYAKAFAIQSSYAWVILLARRLSA